MADKDRSIKSVIWSASLFCLLVNFDLFALSVEEAGKIPLIGHTITVDKNTKDWAGIPPEGENAAVVNNGEYIWKDAAGDDTGNGKYSYPLIKALKKGADLLEFRVTFDRDNLYFLIKTDHPGDWWTPFRIIGIRKEGAAGGMQLLAQDTFANLKLSPKLACHYVIAISSTYKGRIWDAEGRLIAHKEEQSDDTPGFEIDDSKWSAVEVAVPLKLLGVSKRASPAGETWKFIVATGQQDKDIARVVDPEPSELHGGGGSPNHENPNVYDLAGSDRATQEKELGSYDPNAQEGDPKGFATIEESFLTVNFGTK